LNTKYSTVKVRNRRRDRKNKIERRSQPLKGSWRTEESGAGGSADLKSKAKEAFLPSTKASLAYRRA
jgi:hypothetical protein